MIGQGNQDERENSMEESPMMTIEYLRARLLSERSVSKSAKERAEELAKRVEKLEEQLKLVTFQRKRAEKATSEVLSFLASHGIGDISEVDEYESDQDESLCESNEGEYDATQESDNFGPLKLNGNNEGCSSDHDSATSSGRPLSWKGRKQTTPVSNKKHVNSSIRLRGSFSQAGFSQRHRHVKSCRQIKRKEMRSMVEELGHDSAKSDDAQDNKTQDSSEVIAREEVLVTSQEKQFQRVHQKNEVPLSSLPHAQEDDASSPIHKHDCSGDMQRALEHQAKLIGRYEAQEEAQRDWEERYEENNISTPDSCEPGNHSDVTEERDDNKESVAYHGQEPKGSADSNIQGKDSSSVLQFNSFKFSPHADSTIYSHNHHSTDTQAAKSLAPDFSFSSHLNQSVSPTSSSFAGNNSFNESENQNRHREIVPIKGPQKLGLVLGALQEAKLLIKQQMTETNSYSSSGIRDTDWLKVPVASSALFRVPTNLHSQSTTQSRFPGSNYEYSPVLQNLSPYSRAIPSQNDLHSQSPTRSRFPGSDYEYSPVLRNSSPYPRAIPSQDDLHSHATTKSRLQGSDYEYSPVLRNSSPYLIATTHNRFPGSNNDFSSELGNSSPNFNAPRLEPTSYGLVTEPKHGISNGLPGEDFLFDTSQSLSSNPLSPSYPSFPDFFPGTSSKQMSGSRFARK